MRVVLAFFIAALTVLSSAHAQPGPPSVESSPLPPPIAPPDMPNYCVFENRIYSLGSGLCIGRTAYVCVLSTGPATGNRAYWNGKEDQIFARPLCN